MTDKGFYFNKLDLFRNIKNVTTVLGVDPLIIEGTEPITVPTPDVNKPHSVLVRLEALEKGLNSINNTAASTVYVDSELAKKVNKLGDTLLGNLELLVTPTIGNHLINKQYVDDRTSLIESNLAGLETLVDSIQSLYASLSYVDTADAVIQSQINNLTVTVNALSNDPVTKAYVDAADATKVSKTGDVLTGPLTLNAEPTQPLEAASKSYVDSIAQGILRKSTARVLSDTNINGVFLNNNITSNINGTLIIDGVSVSIGDVVILSNQITPQENGAYTVTDTGSLSTPFSLDRYIYSDSSIEIPGSFFFITDGNVYKGTGWNFIVSDPSTFQLNIDPITVTQISRDTVIDSGNGLYFNGNILNIGTVNSSRIVVNSTAIDLAPSGVTPGSYTKVTVDDYGRVIQGSLVTDLDIPDLDWSKIVTGKPTTLSGYGITDALSLNGGNLIGYLFLNSDPTQPLHAATKQYVDGSLNTLTTYVDTKDADLQTQIDVINTTVNILNTDPVTKTYVDTQDSTKLALAGGVMTGPLTLSGLPINPLHASSKQYVDDAILSLTTYIDSADTNIQTQVTTLQTTINTLNTDPVTKAYVDAADATKVSKAGDALTGPLTLHDDPVQALEAATKQYVDNIAKGLRARPSVRLLTTTSLNASYNIASQQLISSIPGILTVDGITPVVGDRIIVKDQTTLTDNGVYEVINNDGTGSYILKRTNLFNESIEIPGSLFFVYDGVVNKGTSWTAIVSNPATFTLDTDSITFTQVNSTINYTAGNGIDLTNDSISVITPNASGLISDSSGVYITLDGNTLTLTPNGLSVSSSILNSKVNKAGDTLTGPLLLFADPSQPLEASTKQYVDTLISSLSTNVNNQLSNLQGQINSLQITVGGLNLDPVTKTYVDTQDATKLNISGGTLTGSLILNNDPSVNLEAATKQYVDSSIANIDISTITTGVLPTNLLPAMTGDVTSSIGTNILTLTNTGVVPGTYTQLTVDSKGRVVSGSQVTSSTLPPVDWNSIFNTPTSLSGYGIIDGVSKNGDIMTGSLILSDDPQQPLEAVTKRYVDISYDNLLNKNGDIMTGSLILSDDPQQPLEAVTKRYVDNRISENIPIGTIIQNASDKTPEGFLRCNGSSVITSLFKDLYDTLKDKETSIYSTGKYWEQQNSIPYPNTNRFYFRSSANLARRIAGQKLVVIDNDTILLLGGYDYNTNIINSSIYKITFDSDYLIRTRELTSYMPVGLVFYEALVIGSYIYIIAGKSINNYSNKIYRSKYNKDLGELENWEVISYLPYGLSNHSCIVIKDNLYIIGGQKNTNTLSDEIWKAKIYNNGTLSNWTPVNTLPYPLKDFNIALTKNKLYIIGGNTDVRENYYRSVNNIFCFDIDFNKIIKHSILPDSLSMSSILVNKNNIYLFGGFRNNSTTNRIYYSKLDLDGNILGFQKSTRYLRASTAGASLVINGDKLSLLGGFSSRTGTRYQTYRCTFYKQALIYSNDKLEYTNIKGYGKPDKLQYMFNSNSSDITNQINTETNIPIYSQNLKSIITKNKLIVLNGNTSEVTNIGNNGCYIYTINNDGSLLLDNIIDFPENLTLSDLVLFNDVIFITGGINESGEIQDKCYKAHIYPNGSISSWNVSTDTHLPIPLYNHNTIIIKNNLFILGGKTSNNGINDVIYKASIINNSVSSFIPVGTLPKPIDKFKSVVIKDKLYILGGCLFGKDVNAIYCSNVNKDGSIGSWLISGILPAGYHSYEVITTANKLWLLNGISSSINNKSLTVNIEKDGSLFNWTEVSIGLENIKNTSISISKNKIYFIGGKDITNGLSNNIYSVDFFGGKNDYLNTNSPILLNAIKTPYLYKIQNEFTVNNDNLLNPIVTDIISSPQPLKHNRVILTNNVIYSLGGRNTSGLVNHIYSYNLNNGILNNSSLLDTVLPVPMSNFNTLILGNMLYLIGGEIGDSSSTSNIYNIKLNSDGSIPDTNSNVFNLVNTLPTALSHSELFITNSSIYVLGGRIDGNLTDVIYSAKVNSDNTLENWNIEHNLPEPLANFKAIQIGKYIYIIGGMSASGPSDKVYKAEITYTGNILPFELYGILPIPMSDFELISNSNTIFILGIKTLNNSEISDIYAINTFNNTKLGGIVSGNITEYDIIDSVLPTGRCNTSAIITSNKLYLFNGEALNSPINEILVTDYNSGYNNYYNYQTLKDPYKFTLPDIIDTGKNTRYNYYIKY